MLLAGTTHILMGPETTLVIDRYTAEAGGELVLGQGAVLFDRDEAAPKTPVSLTTAFGLIAVRGTRFFAGPSKGVFSVFVERGEVQVGAAGQTVALRAGEGVEVAEAGGPPGPVVQWKAARIKSAFASVGL